VPQPADLAEQHQLFLGERVEDAMIGFGDLMEAQRHGSFPLSRLDGEDNGIPPELGGHPILFRKTLPEQVDNHSHHAIVPCHSPPVRLEAPGSGAPS